MQITKTDYLEYSYCKKNLWLKKHKPELFDGVELSEFEKKIIEEGNISDEAARHLFPGGALVDSFGSDAVMDTKAYIKHAQKVIFQATFFVDPLYVRADVMVHNDELGGWELYEVKASNEIKREKDHNHIRDLAFQKEVIEKADVHIVRVGVIHLNREYVFDGTVRYDELFVTEEVTDEVSEMQEEVRGDIENMKVYMSMPEQPGCECVYRGRNGHCTTFGYSNPQVPEYSVHDMYRIGNSKKLLTSWVDKGIFSLADIDDVEKLKGAKRAQYDAYVLGTPIIDDKEIQARLKELRYPLQFFDYEGYATAIPEFVGYRPYEQVPFQYSLHVVHEDGRIEHKEFLITEPKKDITRPLIEQMYKDLDPRGTVIAWYSSYEKQRNQKLAELYPEYEEFLTGINEGMFDLMTIFSEQLYVDARFKGSASIKKVLPVLVPEMSYHDLNIGKGDQASERWQYMISGNATQKEKEQISKDLLEYCKQDTFAMVRIWEVLRS